MSSKIDVADIVRDHFKTLRHYGEGRSSFVDVTVFVICPAFLAVIVFLNGAALEANLVNALINASAIFIGLLLNLLMLMFDQQSKAKARLAQIKQMQEQPTNGEQGSLNLRVEIISEVVSNISFTILACIVSLCLLLVLAARSSESDSGNVSQVLSALNVAIWVNTILTILMIMKRVFKLFKA